ncbi:hypothetical protein [Burkholderia stagnalis]|uniref:hypothetical protein n=1 Tax=Burkholderia stagnalis TaxID=1503054 RepID=UPI003D314A66
MYENSNVKQEKTGCDGRAPGGVCPVAGARRPSLSWRSDASPPESGDFMKRMLLAAVTFAATLTVAHAQTQTYHFGEGQMQPQGAAQPAQPAPLPGATQGTPLPQGSAPSARPAPRRAHVTPHRHYRHAVVKQRHHARHVKRTRRGVYKHT